MAAGSRNRAGPHDGSPASAPYALLNRQRMHRVDRGRILGFLDRLTSHLETDRPFTVVLVSDSVIERYNRRYRGVRAPTDVLSFTGGDDYLGDILISTETAYNQARRSAALSLDTNVERLALHGLLHLMGYDHETDDGEMRALEIRLRRKLRC